MPSLWHVGAGMCPCPYVHGSVLCLGNVAMNNASHVFFQRWIDHFVGKGVIKQDQLGTAYQPPSRGSPQAHFDHHRNRGTVR